MGTFVIDVDEFTWICGPEDDPEDLCLHGHVTVQIGKTVMEYDGTVIATALYLLKTLTEDKVMSECDIQMVPCWVTSILPMETCLRLQFRDVIRGWTGLLSMKMAV